jgi:3-hydroxybutyryl-CoA dehydratase
LEVVEIKARVNLVTLACAAHNQLGQLIAKGVAEVIAPTQKLSLPVPILPAITIA